MGTLVSILAEIAVAIFAIVAGGFLIACTIGGCAQFFADHVSIH